MSEIDKMTDDEFSELVASNDSPSARRIEQLERELAAKTAEFDRLNESLPKTKRLFTNALAETIINNQLKRIKLLEDELILAIKENQ
jgi:hypothetical protein